MVIGDRMDNIQPGAMPWLHQLHRQSDPDWAAQPVLSHRHQRRPLRYARAAARRAAASGLCARPGMEFASEMVIRASKEKLRIAEFPIEYHPRGGESKLSSFRDGWRHLRFLLVHSPNHLFIVPGGAARGSRHADRRVRRRGARLLRTRMGPARADRWRSADDRRHAGARARSVRARVRHVLHGRAGSLVRPDARALSARARAAAGRRVRAGRCGDGRGDPRDVDLPRLRLARRRTPRGDRRVAC